MMSNWTGVLAFSAAAVVLSACSDIVGPNSDINGIEVTLSLPGGGAAVGDTVEIRVVATNVTAGTVSFVTNTCVLVVRVLDESDTLVVDLPNTCNDISQPHSLRPGESLERVVRFDATGRSGTFRLLAGISADLLNLSEVVELTIQP